MDSLKQEQITDMATALTAAAADEGAIVAVGWAAFEKCIMPNMTDLERGKMMIAFYSGALHLFSSIVSFLDPGTQETDQDLRRMDNLNEELRRFEDMLKEKMNAKR